MTASALTMPSTSAVSASAAFDSALRRSEVCSQLIEGGTTAEAARAWATKIVHTELMHPDLAGKLCPNDFTTAAPHLLDVEPPPDRARALIADVRSRRRDFFPEWDISAASAHAKKLQRISSFLRTYRTAERVFRDGGREHAHCADSANLVAGLLLLKGFEAFAVWTARMPDEAMGSRRMIARLRSCTSAHPLPLARLLRHVEDRMAVDSFVELARGLDIVLANPADAMDALSSMHADDRGALATALAKSEMHCVTAFALGSAFYLADIDAQQFGPASDRLVIVREEEATSEGLLLSHPLAIESERRCFLDRLRPFESHFAREQLLIRQRLVAMGALAP